MLQYLIIGLVVLYSTIYAFKQLMPKTAKRVFAGIAERLRQIGLMRLANWLAPQHSTGGCGGCGYNTPSKKPVVQEISPVKWK